MKLHRFDLAADVLHFPMDGSELLLKLREHFEELLLGNHSHWSFLAQQLHIIVLDQRIGEQLVGGLLEGGLRLLAVAALDLDVEHLALPHARNPCNAERLERTLDRLSLRIEDAEFQRDNDPSLHDVRASPAIWCESAPWQVAPPRTFAT